MAVFNSLGSNYSGRFVLKSLFSVGSAQDRLKLRQALQSQLGGQATLTYKGRQALELALRQSGLEPGAQVGINGFTCYVVYQAVERAGYQAVFLDVEPGSLHFGLKQLQDNPDLKAIIVQNTLGLPVPISVLEKYSQQHKLLMIEDLAHSFGAVYQDGRPAGTVGELVMLSFSQDKFLDVVAAGALVDRRTKPGSSASFPKVSAWQRTKNRAYPFWTALIRTTYGVGLGRYLHFGLKKLKLLATPMSDNLTGIRAMSDSTAKLLLARMNQQSEELKHRQAIAAIYQENLPKTIQYKVTGVPSYLRFPIITTKRMEVIEVLRQTGIHIGDTWYDAPVAPRRYLAKTTYQSGDCPEAEKLAATMVNLPTHQHITPEVAREICAKIKQCLAVK